MTGGDDLGGGGMPWYDISCAKILHHCQSIRTVRHILVECNNFAEKKKGCIW